MFLCLKLTRPYNLQNLRRLRRNLMQIELNNRHLQMKKGKKCEKDKSMKNLNVFTQNFDEQTII